VFDDVLKKPCPYHKTPFNHTLKQCDMLKKYYSRAAAKEGEAKKDGGDGGAGGFPALENVFLIFGGLTVNMSNSQRKRERHEVLATEKAPPSFLDWSEDVITFSREDHPNRIPNPGQYPLVVDLVIGNSRFSKVLMDGGVQRRLRCFDEERRRAIGVELRKLLEDGFIKEVFHPTWLANLVLVKKKNGKWRMCVDYTGLNKAGPKVPFPLPRIDQIVDSTTGCELLCFHDAYSTYHQIKMKESDQLATSFITPFGMFCYVTMPFGLRNAGATYQRCMQHVFGDHIGRTIEAYVDDIVIKTRKADDLVGDLRIAFD
jgi:hypothetical protein